MRRIKFFSIDTGVKCIAVAAVTIFALAPNSHAVTQDVSLTAAPAILDVGGKPGEEIEVSFRLTNNTEGVVPVQVVARDSTIRNGQTAELVRSLSAKSWLNFKQPDLVLQAKESKSIQALLRIPKDASPGGHYADLIAQPLALEGSEGFIATQSELAVQLLINVAGKVDENVSVDLSGPSSVIISRGTSKKLVFDVVNRGNSHILFHSRLYLKNGGNNHTTLELLPQIILPSERKQVAFDLPNGLTLGVHNAQIRFNYGVENKEAKSSVVRIIVVPFGSLFLLAFPMLGLTIYGFRIRHRILAAVKVFKKGT